MKALLLWFVRKAIYVVVAAALGAGVAYVTNHPDLSTWSLAGAIAALSSVVVRELLTKLLPDVYEWLGGADPRANG